MNDKEKFRIMIQLALVDNQFEDAERDFIHSLANKSSLSSEELEDIIQEELQKKNHEVDLNTDLGFDAKIEILADIVRVMKSDGKVYLSEIKFCEMIAKMFGFKEKSIGMLSKMLNHDGSADWPTLKEKMQKLKS
ncbi:TerB family tellurite resistance protein [Ekhidna sp. To15]|uniref:TerB family tellurite resistance protein n=1 Tax=Ekhidna sp. To15 TaxID=3395267 RepID=UPI003F5235C0